jgi:2,3-bisphosphoglycerate-independent phosphoglycerate mutase
LKGEKYMKYIVILGDGMAGEPLAQLGNKTTLEAAATPMMDDLAAKGEMGLAAMVPANMKPGSDVANLAVMGYDPQKYYSGRSPLEALSRGCSLLVSRGAGICELLNLEEMDRIENPLDTEELKSKLLWIHHHPNHSRLALPKRSWDDAVAELARLCEGGRP